MHDLQLLPTIYWFQQQHNVQKSVKNNSLISQALKKDTVGKESKKYRHFTQSTIRWWKKTL